MLFDIFEFVFSPVGFAGIGAAVAVVLLWATRFLPPSPATPVFLLLGEHSCSFSTDPVYTDPVDRISATAFTESLTFWEGGCCRYMWQRQQHGKRPCRTRVVPTAATDTSGSQPAGAAASVFAGGCGIWMRPVQMHALVWVGGGRAGWWLAGCMVVCECALMTCLDDVEM